MKILTIEMKKLRVLAVAAALTAGLISAGCLGLGRETLDQLMNAASTPDDVGTLQPVSGDGSESVVGSEAGERPAQDHGVSPPDKASAVAAQPTAPPPPTPTPHPLSIDWLRDRTVVDGELAIEETLSAGSNYSRELAYYSSEGLKVYALLTIPNGDPPSGGFPVIVFNHGYIPPSQYRTTERYVAYVDAFASSGYIVVKPDYRGHGESEGEARGGYASPDYTVDVLHALAAARRLPQADPDRVGMWGHSMGGHITLRSMVVTDSIKAGVIWAGVVASYPDLFARWHRRTGAESDATPRPSSRGRWRGELSAEFGSPDENPAFWASLSADSYLADVSGPIQLHHGTADTSVPVEFSENLHARLQQLDRASELYLYEGDDHNLSGNLYTALGRSVEFFDRHLKTD